MIFRPPATTPHSNSGWLQAGSTADHCPLAVAGNPLRAKAVALPRRETRGEDVLPQIN
jgi:hypothetical protein